MSQLPTVFYYVLTFGYRYRSFIAGIPRLKFIYLKITLKDKGVHHKKNSVSSHAVCIQFYMKIADSFSYPSYCFRFLCFIFYVVQLKKSSPFSTSITLQNFYQIHEKGNYS